VGEEREGVEEKVEFEQKGVLRLASKTSISFGLSIIP
jgi:hypothetical protein